MLLPNISCTGQMLSFCGYENSRERDCNGLNTLIHPGLVQVHQATKIRNSKAVCLFPLSLTISSVVFLHVAPDHRRLSQEAAAAEIQGARKSLFLPVDYFSAFAGIWNPQTTKVAGSHLCCLTSSEVNRNAFAASSACHCAIFCVAVAKQVVYQVSATRFPSKKSVLILLALFNKQS